MIDDRLVELGYEVLDLGTKSNARVDYPDYGKSDRRSGRRRSSRRFGIAVCGSGIGICIAANKVHGIRAATVHDVTSARLSREHNNANIMCVGERFLGPQVVWIASTHSSAPSSKAVATAPGSPNSIDDEFSGTDLPLLWACARAP